MKRNITVKIKGIRVSNSRVVGLHGVIYVEERPDYPIFGEELPISLTLDPDPAGYRFEWSIVEIRHVEHISGGRGISKSLLEMIDYTISSLANKITEDLSMCSPKITLAMLLPVDIKYAIDVDRERRVRDLARNQLISVLMGK